MKSSQLRNAVEEFTTGFNPARMSARDAEHVRDDVSAMKNMLSTVEALAAARVAETKVWREGGDRSAAHELARKTGTSVGVAKETIETGKRLKELPKTSKAARKGKLSIQQAAAVADAASADPDAEGRLLDSAASGSLSELRSECARVKASACDLEARRRRLHERRHLRTWTDGEGAGHLHLCDNPERVAEIAATLTPTRDRLARAAQRAGRREPLEAHGADALHQMVCGKPGRARPSGRTTMLVRVDLERLLGAPAGEDAVCEIAGFGPVAPSAVRDLLDTGDPFLAAIVTKGKEVVGVAHLGRRPNAHQRSALEWLYPTCAVEGCNALTYLETDHREDWVSTHTTVLDLLDRLCSHHHRLKTTDDWALVEGRGKRALVPPDDSRHPRQRRPRPARRHTAAVA